MKHHYVRLLILVAYIISVVLSFGMIHAKSNKYPIKFCQIETRRERYVMDIGFSLVPIGNIVIASLVTGVGEYGLDYSLGEECNQ